MASPAPRWALLIQGQRMLPPLGSAPSWAAPALFGQVAPGKPSDPTGYFSPLNSQEIALEQNITVGCVQ